MYKSRTLTSGVSFRTSFLQIPRLSFLRHCALPFDKLLLPKLLTNQQIRSIEARKNEKNSMFVHLPLKRNVPSNWRDEGSRKPVTVELSISSSRSRSHFRHIRSCRSQDLDHSTSSPLSVKMKPLLLASARRRICLHFHSLHKMT